MKQNEWDSLVSRAKERLQAARESDPQADLERNGTIWTLARRVLPDGHADTLLAILADNPALFWQAPLAGTTHDTLALTVTLVIHEELERILLELWRTS